MGRDSFLAIEKKCPERSDNGGGLLSSSSRPKTCFTFVEGEKKKIFKVTRTCKNEA